MASLVAANSRACGLGSAPRQNDELVGLVAEEAECKDTLAGGDRAERVLFEFGDHALDVLSVGAPIDVGGADAQVDPVRIVSEHVPRAAGLVPQRDRGAALEPDPAV